MGEAAGKVHVPPFEPKQGVRIETDPKATSVSSAAALGDDEGVIDGLIKRLQVRCWAEQSSQPGPSHAIACGGHC